MREQEFAAWDAFSQRFIAQLKQQAPEEVRPPKPTVADRLAQLFVHTAWKPI